MLPIRSRRRTGAVVVDSTRAHARSLASRQASAIEREIEQGRVLLPAFQCFASLNDGGKVYVEIVATLSLIHI